MALQTVYSSESWEKVYSAFSQVNFSSFDFDTVKQSIIQYLQTYYAESFNDLIESSELIAIVESFCYIAEQLAYRLDMLSHEQYITTASRKQSILKLAKIISYRPTRNIPARGLVKITSISTTETLIDSSGNNLANKLVLWNDANNTNWKNQFFAVMNAVITTTFGQYNSTVQIGDVTMQTYTFNNNPKLMNNGVYAFTVDTGLQSFPMEVVSADVDANGPFEKTPDINSQMSFLYSSDGLGDSSDYTGFMFYIKQGTLTNIPYNFTTHIPNNTLMLNTLNINDTDVWVNAVDNTGTITAVWTQVQSLLDQNIMFNSLVSTNKYEVETLENDAIKLIFGDGDFAAMPYGSFYIWVRQSINQSVVIQPNSITNQQFSFQYTSRLGNTETCSITFSLNSTIQNSAASETIDHIRQSAPSTYYAQNRMVNAQDYNTYMLRDQSILRLNSINRTFAGQPKYIQWNDASGQYENVKLFGDDLQLYQTMTINTINTDSTINGRNLIDNVLEPILSSTSLVNLLNFVNVTNPITNQVISIPRRHFIEDNHAIYFGTDGVTRTSLLEKTNIQGVIDQHYYGEPRSYATINGATYAVILDPTLNPSYNGQLWLSSISRTVDGLTAYIPGDVGSGLQSQSWQQNFGLCFNNNSPIIGSDFSFSFSLLKRVASDEANYASEVFTIEVAANGSDLYVASSIQGAIGTGSVGKSFLAMNPLSPIDFTLTQTTNPTYPLTYGDVIRLEAKAITINAYMTAITSYSVTSQAGQPTATSLFLAPNAIADVTALNVLGRWEVINGIDLVGTTTNPINPNNLPYDPTLYLSSGARNPNSWVIWVQQILNPVTQIATSFVINYRELSLHVSSANTKFWYNSNQLLLDPVTQDVVYDQIRILRSNLRPDMKPVGYNGQVTATGKYVGNNEIYDVVGPVKDNSGIIDVHSLEIMVSDALLSPTGGSMQPTNILQFDNFVDAGNNASQFYQYFELDSFGNEITGTRTNVYPASVIFNNGSFGSKNLVGGIRYGRQLVRTDIDFMWQHFTGYSNMVDPSVSNIHDVYLITQGYYNNMVSYLRGAYNYVPQPPTPLELRNDYGYLLDNKMLSDTVVLHSGNFKLLFGALADPQLQGQFKIVQAMTSTLSQERIKNEALNVINSYFSIANWEFGQTFYVTELLGLIHQRLPTDVASVVLVPTYSVNGFGSLFEIHCGIDEILMSAATIDNVVIVSELNTAILRQGTL